MNNGQNINLVWFEVIDGPLWPFNDLSNLLHFVLRHLTARQGKIGNLL
ncbi:MAG: hypothetical protein U1C55_09870 [Smithellaceae bacterium]|nr:hypothetical protein [Smithellaceae bacterium]